MEFVILYIVSIIVSVAAYIYTNYDEGHDLDICMLGQMFALGSIPILNILTAITIFVDNMDFKFDCSKIILMKGKKND